MNAETKRQVWALLVEHCGANPGQWPEFEYHFPGCGEFRFQGSLGFGGKVYAGSWSSRDVRVGCYREDETPERRAAIDTVNEALRAALAAAPTPEEKP